MAIRKEGSLDNSTPGAGRPAFRSGSRLRIVSDLCLVVPAHTDTEGVVRSLIVYGGDDAPDHFRASLVPAQGDPLRIMDRILAPGWEEYTLPHHGVDFNEVSGVTFLGLDVLRDGIRLSVLRCFPLGASAEPQVLAEVVRDASRTVRRLVGEGEAS